MALAAAPPADAGDGGYAAVAEFKLVDDTPVSVPNPIVDGRTFVKQGGNRFFTTEQMPAGVTVALALALAAAPAPAWAP